MFLFLIIIFLIITPAEGGGEEIWKILLHYRDGESVIDDPSFFLDPQGRKDPRMELEAFLKEIRRDPSIACRFPARAFYVRNWLGVKIPPQECAELQRFLRELEGSRISIIYADSHMGSPASMFGHTFLRIFSSEKNLYSFIVNYAAEVEREPGITYAIKGLTGGYRGYFSVGPYFEKIREYSGIEGRDLWEYELSVDPQRVMLFKLHLWELRRVYSYYYFFHKNCSSEVFNLLRIFYPDKEFRLKTSWTLPIDTIKYLLKEDLVKEVRFNPSLQKRIEAGSEDLSREELELIKEWVRGNRSLPEGRKGVFYDVASDYVRFMYYGGALEIGRYRKLYLASLKNRSTAEGGGLEIKKIKGERPDHSHGTQRLRIGYGYKKGAGGFLDIAYRPVYHDLVDPPAGYRRSSEVVFSEFVIRYFAVQNRLFLQRWTAIRITSLERRGVLFKPLSWFVNTGYKRDIDGRGVEGGFLYLNSGGGLTLGRRELGLSLLPEVRVRAFGDREGLSGGGGFKVLILRQGNRTSFRITASGGIFLAPSGNHIYRELEATAGIHLFRNLSLRFSGRYFSLGGKDSLEASGSWALYF